MRQLVGEAGGDQERTSAHDVAAFQSDGEAVVRSALDGRDPRGLDRATIAEHLGAAGRQKVGGGHPVAGEEAVHLGRGGIAGFTGVDHQRGPPRSGEHKGRAEAGGPTADDDHVVVGSGTGAGVGVGHGPIVPRGAPQPGELLPKLEHRACMGG